MGIGTRARTERKEEKSCCCCYNPQKEEEEEAIQKRRWRTLRASAAAAAAAAGYETMQNARIRIRNKNGRKERKGKIDYAEGGVISLVVIA